MSNGEWVWKIAIFAQYISLSRKWYKIGTQLLWNANRNSYAICRMSDLVKYSMPRSIARPFCDMSFTPLLPASCWRWGCDLPRDGPVHCRLSDTDHQSFLTLSIHVFDCLPVLLILWYHSQLLSSNSLALHIVVACPKVSVFFGKFCPSQYVLPSCGVRPSVRLPRSYILSKWIKISSRFFHYRVATQF